MKRALRMIVLVAVVAMPAYALGSTSHLQVWVANCNQEQYKPARLVITCGDGGTFLKNLKWRHWSATKATGTGIEWVNKCTPDCAAGHYSKTRAAVTLTTPKRCRKQKHMVFDRLTMRFQGVTGPHATETDTLGCPFK